MTSGCGAVSDERYDTELVGLVGAAGAKRTRLASVSVQQDFHLEEVFRDVFARLERGARIAINRLLRACHRCERVEDEARLPAGTLGFRRGAHPRDSVRLARESSERRETRLTFFLDSGPVLGLSNFAIASLVILTNSGGLLVFDELDLKKFILGAALRSSSPGGSDNGERTRSGESVGDEERVELSEGSWKRSCRTEMTRRGLRRAQTGVSRDRGKRGLSAGDASVT